MEYRKEVHGDMSEEEWAQLEAKMHDSQYKDTRPFRQSSLRIDVEDVWSTYDHIYRKGADHRGYRKRRMMKALNLAQIRDKVVLDAGCGNGQYAVFAAIHGAEVHAVDLSGEGVRVGRAIAEANGVEDSVSFYRQSANRLGFKDEMFDLIFYNEVLHHALKYDGLSDEARRVLKPGGRIVYAAGIRSNPIYNALRSVYKAVTGEEGKGDIDITYDDIKSFGAGLDHIHEERFCLTLSCKELIGKEKGNDPLRRTLFYVFKRLDDVVLTSFPSTDQYTKETVGVFRKPVLNE